MLSSTKFHFHSQQQLTPPRRATDTETAHRQGAASRFTAWTTARRTAAIGAMDAYAPPPPWHALAAGASSAVMSRLFTCGCISELDCASGFVVATSAHCRPRYSLPPPWSLVAAVSVPPQPCTPLFRRRRSPGHSQGSASGAGRRRQQHDVPWHPGCLCQDRGTRGGAVGQRRCRCCALLRQASRA